jgi:hypothetical protein
MSELICKVLTRTAEEQSSMFRFKPSMSRFKSSKATSSSPMLIINQLKSLSRTGYLTFIERISLSCKQKESVFQLKILLGHTEPPKLAIEIVDSRAAESLYRQDSQFLPNGAISVIISKIIKPHNRYYKC